MNERNVASGGDSLYPSSRGRNMAGIGESQIEEGKRQGGDEGSLGNYVGQKGSRHLSERKLQEHAEHLRQKLSDGTQIAVSETLIKGLAGKLVKEGRSEDEVARMKAERVISESIRGGESEGRFGVEEIGKHVKVISDEKLEKLSTGEDALVLGDEARPLIIIETKKKAEYIESRKDAEVLLRANGLDLDLPEKWERWPIVKRWRWLIENNVYQFDGWTKEDAKNLYLESTIPEVAGGSIDWDDPLKMKAVRRYRNKDGDLEEGLIDVDISFGETIRRLIELKKEGVDLDADAVGVKNKDDWGKLLGLYRDKIEEIKNILNDRKDSPRGYEMIAKMSEEIKDLRAKYDLLGAKDFGVFRSIVSVEDEKLIGLAKDEVNDSFRKKIADRSSQEIKALFKNIEDAANQVTLIQRGGLYAKADDHREKFERVVAEELRKNPEFRDLLEWKAQVLREGFDLQFAVITAEQPPADWRDSERNVDAILRFLESTDFDQQQLQQKIQSAVAIVTSIPVDSLSGSERDVALELRKRLTERYESVIAINQFYSTMEAASMDPEKVSQVFTHFKDDTFQQFFGRFTKDARGKELDLAGQEHLKPEERKKLNLLDVGMKIYMRRFNRERILMNFIEEWTRDRGKKGTTDEQKAALDFINGEISGGKGIKEAVAYWYRTKTLLGTMKEDKEGTAFRKREMVGDTSVFGGEAALGDRLWKEGFLEELVKHKGDWNLSDLQIREMVDSGLVDQVINNAHRLSWVMAWSDYDGIRIWDPKAENPARPGLGRVVAYVYNQSTDFFYGRMGDHTWEFYIDEKRGRVPKTNLIMQDELLGDYGNLLPQNRTMVRFTADLLGKKAEEIFEKYRRSFKNVDKFNQDDPEEMAWLKSAIIAEAIDKGILSYEDANFSEAFNVAGSWKYKMIDLYGDRTAMKGYVGDPLQEYLETPNSRVFMEINSKKLFYSKRLDARMKPWMRLVIPSHLRTGERWKNWWGLTENMLHAEKEEVIEAASDSNRLDARYKDPMKHRYLGWFGVPGFAPVRGGRQFTQAAALGGKTASKDTLLSFWWRGPLATAGTGLSQGFKLVLS